jgi:hypothetical protein
MVIFQQHHGPFAIYYGIDVLFALNYQSVLAWCQALAPAWQAWPESVVESACYKPLLQRRLVELASGVPWQVHKAHSCFHRFEPESLGHPAAVAY